MVSLLLMSVALALVLQLYGIRSRLWQVLLPAVVITSALHTSIFLFMFTSTPYALAILLAVLAVHYAMREGWRSFAIGCLCLVLSMSLYQMYLTLSIALLVVLASLRLLDAKPVGGATALRAVLRSGGFIAVAVVIYFAIALGLIMLKGGLAHSHYGYATGGSSHVPLIVHFTGVFTNLAAIVFRGALGIVNTGLSRVLHIVLLLGVLSLVLVRQWRVGTWRRVVAQMLLLLVALPATIHLLWIIVAPAHWKTLTVYAFVAVYVLAVAVARREYAPAWLRDVVAVCLMGITVSNIYYDNRTYLQVHQQNVNNYSFYGGLVSQIKLMPELRHDTPLALIGEAKELVYDTEAHFGENDIIGSAPLLNAYSRRDFIIKHTGFDIKILNAADPLLHRLENDPRVKAMPVYPYHGSIAAVDSIIVVKLGEGDN